jgi:hypothetical protein
LPAYREDPSFFAVAQALGQHHQMVQRQSGGRPRLGWCRWRFAIALSFSTSPYPNLRATIQSPAATLP